MLVTLTVNVADFFINPEMFLATHVHILPSCDVTQIKLTRKYHLTPPTEDGTAILPGLPSHVKVV